MTAKTVSQVLADLIDDEAAREDIENEIQSQRLSTILFSLRCRYGLTQKQMAAKIGCTQSQISKLEHAKPDQISVKDLEDYGSALGIDVVIRFQRSMTAVERANRLLEWKVPRNPKTKKLSSSP